MHWQRLDRDNSVKVIESVKSDDNAGMFSVGTSEVQRALLPFYKEYGLYKVTNYASLPSFTFEYLSDGTFFHYLDGSESPIHTVNDKNTLVLNERNIMNYLNFYFAHVSGEDGDIIVIDNPHDMPLLDSLDADAYNAVFNHHKPANVQANGNDGSYTVEADIYKDSQIVRATIEVTMKGRVSISAQNTTMHEVLASDAPEAIM